MRISVRITFPIFLSTKTYMEEMARAKANAMREKSESEKTREE